MSPRQLGGKKAERHLQGLHRKAHNTQARSQMSRQHRLNSEDRCRTHGEKSEAMVSKCLRYFSFRRFIRG